jgi:hypothetical protein
MIREAGGVLARPLWLDLLELRLSRGAQFAIAYAVALVPAVALALVQPVWQLTDEAQHYDVIAQYAHGVFPQEGETTLRPETAAIMQATGNYRWSPPGSVPRPAITDPAEFSTAPPYLSDKVYQLWVRRHIWWFSYEAMQPPLFYATATPVWIAANHAGGPLEAVYAVRLLNAMALALLGPLTLLAIGLLMPSARWVGITALAVTAAMPGLLINGTQVTNDTFGAVAGSASIVTAAWMARRGWTRRTALLLGALFGLTLLSKLTAIGIVAGLAAAWAWPLLRLGAPLGRQVRFGVLAALTAGAVLTPWLALNVVSSGTLVPTSAAARLMGAGTSGSHFTIWQSLSYCFVTFWTGEHLNTLPYTGAVVVLTLALGILSAVGVQRLARGTAWLRAQPAGLTVFLASVAGQAAWALSLPTLGGLGGMAPGRYLYPAAAAALALFVAGLVAVLRTPSLRALAVAALVALSAASFVAYAYGSTAIAHEERNGPPTNVAVQNASGEGFYRGVTVAVDRVVTDQRVGSVWVHIHVTNSSPLPADWWPAPSVQVSNGVHTSADYGSSTPFPETLPGNSDYWGWMRLGLPPRRVPSGATLTLTFWDVAANHYRDVGNVVFQVALPQPVSPPSVPPAPRAE